MRAKRPWAWPLVPLYRAGQRLEAALAREPRSLRWPVLSVGSLSAGGAGKTPVVIALAKLLEANGRRVDVLSRGYGRAGKEPELVRPEADEAAALYGDEPVLIARRTHADVWVHRSRWIAGTYAEAASESPAIHLLDDGFQHRQLARAFDAVLVTAEDLDDALLPAGNLREPWSALARADAALIRFEERERVIPWVRERMRADAKVWIVRRSLHFPPPLGVLSAGLRPLALCGLARPESFAAMVNAAGCGLVDTMIFPDHHAYTMADMDEIVRTAERLRISGFVTTEKDRVKLTDAMRTRLEAVGPVVVAALEVDFADPAGVLAHLKEALA